MSTNKTQNYQLHSWLPRDEFHVSEINENFTALDAALKAEAGSREGAVSALAAALNGRLQIAVGSYAGEQAINHDTPQYIELGFQPKAVLIGYWRGFVDNLSNVYGGLATETCDMSGSVVLDDTGFTVRNVNDEKLRPNSKSAVYCYLVVY